MARKRIQTVYLYADDHAVALWEKNDPQAGKVEWAEIHERWGPQVLFCAGRLVLKPEMAQLLKSCVGVSAAPARIEAGSPNTRERGIALDTLSLRVRGAEHPVILHGIPEWLSGPWRYQGDVDETFDQVKDAPFWSTVRVAKVHYRKRKKVTA